MQYDRGTATLTITYVSGLIYEYLQVPESVYLEMKRAGSKGAYLNHYIKGRYDYRKVRPKVNA